MLLNRKRYAIPSSCMVLVIMCMGLYFYSVMDRLGISGVKSGEKSDNNDNNNNNNINLKNPSLISPIHKFNKNHYLKYQVCGGFTNQLLSIIDGIVVGYILNSKIILPNLYSNYNIDNADMKFYELYDMEYFISELSKLNVTIVPDVPANNIEYFIGDIERKMLNVDTATNLLIKMFDSNDKMFNDWLSLTNVVISTNCTIFSADIKFDNDLINLRWKIFESLRLKPELHSYIELLTNNIGVFNSLHIRFESDWKKHCKTWKGDNCDIYSLAPNYFYNSLQIEKLSQNIPLYIATALTEAEVRSDPALHEITKKYDIYFNRQIVDSKILQPHLKSGSENREIHAAIDFFILKKSKTFIGNSVSTFSALLMLHRKCNNLSFHYYNSGNIPLENIMFDKSSIDKVNKPLKWVFATNEESAHLFEDIKIAVYSALKNTKLIPYCIFAGKPNQVSNWLLNNGVYVIFHKLSIKDDLLRLVEDAKTDHSIKYSPLFSKPHAVLGTYARIDIPILGFMDEYVLYTDTDIVFLQDIKLSDFNKLPKYVACGPEANKVIDNVYNAGIMLINVRGMANSYDDYIKFILSNKNGLMFKYGALDQGSLNEFYEGKIDFLLPIYNWKPYYTNWYKTIPKILHFHGPKLIDYEEYINDGKILRSAYLSLLRRCYLPNSSCLIAMKIYKEMVDKI